MKDINRMGIKKKKIEDGEIEWPEKLTPAPPCPRHKIKVKVKNKGRSKPIVLPEPKG